MRDIAHKPNTLRIAIAEARLHMKAESVRAIQENKGPKPDILATARAAGYLAIKNTAATIPHCHPLPVEAVRIDFDFSENEIRIEVEAKTIYKTGLEIEAMHGASIAALTIYDMMKPIDTDIEIRGIKLLEKRGGKTDWLRKPHRELKAGVLVCSDVIWAGEKEDLGGKIIQAGLEKYGMTVQSYQRVQDDFDLIQGKVKAMVEEGLDLIVTAGGTGIHLKDVTPQAVRPLLDIEIQGIMDAARNYGQQRTPKAMISRGVAGIADKSLILCLPGSQRGAAESMDALFPALLHIFKVMDKHRN